MAINDLIFALGTIVFLLALIPSLITKNKPNKKTSIITSLVLYVFTFNYISLAMYFSAAVGFVTATAWLVLYFQSRKVNKIESHFST
jgi:hypothetical protein